MRLDVKRQLFARSERVKGIDFHPVEPWILTTLYSGHVYIWSYETQAIVKTFELTDVPVRAGRFIARKNWIVCGSDDFQLRVYNYNTSEKITTFEAHPDYIRAIVVHPTQPFVLTASDDMTIKLWDWDKGWKLEQSLNYGLERAWCVSYQRGKQGVAVGFDEGAVVVKMGREEPAVSMDNSGKLIWARHSEVVSSIIKGGVSHSVKIFKNFVEKSGGLDVSFQAEGLTGGVLLGVKGQGDFSRENYIAALNAGAVDEDGVEAAFEVVTDINETIRTGEWVGDCFIYTNSTNRLNYLCGDQTYTISHFDQPICQRHFVCPFLSLSSNTKTLVLRDDMDTAAEVLATIPGDQLNKIARFLEGQGHKELALEVATDSEHKFELALALGHLPIALELAREADVEHKWKTVGDAALAGWDVALAAECFKSAKDLGSLLLLHSSTGDREGLKALRSQASEAGAHNVAFTCLWQLGDVDGCIELLIKTGRAAEAVLFSQTYKPSITVKTVHAWKAQLENDKKGRVAKTVGVPGEDEDLFPEWEEYLRLEQEVNGDGPDPDAEDVEEGLLKGEEDVEEGSEE
ncbi:hypothetical protein DID88_009270 [Monilinia fructigena]|uniref:Beta'-coat protein n=1 Tax=Monilinia fructigena TaxID=38457 RepID=A0A395IKR4_9HELO|nr:hypothetical protein DID88_009270 [Monilinia fructigena]